ncbi:MAG: beta-glucosidase BglX [Bacteroidales bacterium]|nr:beta-glucosidase BglX [Bacteroidales bacterium]
MKKNSILFSFLMMVFAMTLQAQPMPDEIKMKKFISELMAKMTLEEKVGQLNLPGSGDIVTGQTSSSDIGLKIKEGKVGGLLNLKSVEKIRDVQKVAVEETRLKIPLIFGMDVVHGYQTTFPIPLGLAASWDMGLIEKSARIAAQEATADGICWTYSPMVDIARDPRWGRIAEGSGEDAYLGSQVAEAFVHGYQGNDLTKKNTMMSCVKHFALYGAAEGGRDYNSTDMSFQRMYNEYLPPYKAAVDAGAGSVMCSFNDINGIPATANKWLLTDLLRGEWGFNGFVVTDFTGINELMEHGLGDLQTVSALALKAGVDMDMVGEGFLTTVKKSFDEGKISQATIDQACRRVLEAKYKLGLFNDPFRYCDVNRAKTEIATPENFKAAREIATQTFVLLKNDKETLPIQKKGKIALIGPLADSRKNMAGTWSVAVDHDQSVTVIEGFREVVGNEAEIVYAKGCNITDDPKLDEWSGSWGESGIDPDRTPAQLREEAVEVASKCDVVVAVMGESAEMSGECSSRSDISLPGSQKELLEALLKTGKPVVLVLFTGRPLILNWENENIPAILNVWFGGSTAGQAIADVVFGAVNPSGKLPVTFPQNVGQIPLYYNHKNTGRPLGDDEWFTKFLSNYLDVTNDPLYPFGYGLSYTSFTYSGLKLDQNNLTGNQTLKASIDVTNSGKYDGEEVVQLYIRDLVGSMTRPVKELKGFQKVFIKAGETKTVTFDITPEDLKFYNYDLKFDWESGDFVIMVGGNSRDVETAQVSWMK